MNEQLKESLISTGDSAFMALTQQIQHMLDLIDFYMMRYRPDDSAEHDSLAFKNEQLKPMIQTLGSTPYQLAEVIRRWRHDEPRVLSKLGVELTLINEIWATLEATMVFFIQHDIDLEPYNRSKAERAVQQLKQVNSCML